jgi:hypothetical protein
MQDQNAIGESPSSWLAGINTPHKKGPAETGPVVLRTEREIITEKL